MGAVEVQVALPGQIEPDVLVVPIPAAGGPLSDGARILDERLQGRLQRLIADGEFRGELGKTLVLHTDGELRARRVAVAGIGAAEELDADGIRTAASAVARAARDVGGTIAWLLDERLPLPIEEQARAVVEGIVLGSYLPGRWKTKPRPDKEIARVILCAGDEPGLVEAATRSARVAQWVNWARDLANSPPNELTPADLAQRAAQLDLEHLSAEALDERQIDELGMGAPAAVGRASANGPRLIVLRYDPPSPGRAELTLGLVGKGITFDAGGISIKPGLHMQDMKGDMAGGAAVVAGAAAGAHPRAP